MPHKGGRYEDRVFLPSFMLKRVLIIAGEASGDLHGAGVVRELKKRIPDLDIFGIGGDRMRREGMETVIHISSMSFMGFAEVVRNLPFIRKVERMLESLLSTRPPDVVVLIDYPGFNLRFARRVKRKGIAILYYISPQVWAWHRSRVKKMKGIIDRMLVVFPFEVPFYEKEGIPVQFVGHPLVESIGLTLSRPKFCTRHNLRESKKILALLPGSRLQEIERILPTMIKAARELQHKDDVQPVVGVSSNLGSEVMRRYIPEDCGFPLVENGTYDLMASADAAIVTSGTATLETGWFGTPMAVVYKTSPLTFLIGRMLVDVPHIGLVNIVAGKGIVPEFIQGDMTSENLVAAIRKILADVEYGAVMRKELAIIKQKLEGPGASSRVAEQVIALGEAA
jgi:lipid-A-disaccharide synthase